MRKLILFSTATLVAVLLVASLAAPSHLPTQASARQADAVSTKETDNISAWRVTMKDADPARIASIEKLLRVTKEAPASAYVTLPVETTLTESRLQQALAYLTTSRPTDGGDGPTGARHMTVLIRNAADQYRPYLVQRLAQIAERPKSYETFTSPIEVVRQNKD
jgi:hypothetical protein